MQADKKALHGLSGDGQLHVFSQKAPPAAAREVRRPPAWRSAREPSRSPDRACLDPAGHDRPRAGGAGSRGPGPEAGQTHEPADGHLGVRRSAAGDVAGQAASGGVRPATACIGDDHRTASGRPGGHATKPWRHNRGGGTGRSGLEAGRGRAGNTSDRSRRAHAGALRR